MHVLKAGISWGRTFALSFAASGGTCLLAREFCFNRYGTTSTPLQLRIAGAAQGRDRRGAQGVTWSGRRCSPAQLFLAWQGRGTAGLSPGGWDRSLPAGKELQKPVAGSGRASSCRSSFPSASAVPAPLSALFGALEARLRQPRLCATEGSVAVPAGAKLSVPGLKGKPLPDRNVK